MTRSSTFDILKSNNQYNELWDLPFDRKHFQTPCGITMLLSALMHVPASNGNIIYKQYHIILQALMSCASKHIYRRAATNNDNHYVADNMIFLVPAIVSILLAGKDASSHLGDITENCADLMYMQGGFGINDVVKDYGTIIKNDIDTIMVNIIQKWWNIPTTSNVDGLLKLNTTKDGGINVMEEARPIIDIIEQFFSSWRNDNGKGNDLFEQNLKLAYILNLIYLTFGIILFYFSFLKAREKGTLINMGE